jgi:aspartate kinase
VKKNLIVQKFGGTSMGSVENIRMVAQHIIHARDSGKQVLAVVSAMSGETDRLLALAHQIDSVPHARELDVLLSSGEQASMALLAIMLNRMGYPARSYTGAQLGIVTTNQHNHATIQQVDTALIEQRLNQMQIVIVAGFQGVTHDGDITTLGRGGSDTTAVTLAGCLGAQECQIFTDVDGVYTCDPRIVPTARKLEAVDFPSMEEMSRKGAKVLHLPCVRYAWQNKVPLRVLSTFHPNKGTLIQGECESADICGIAVQRDMVKIDIQTHRLDIVLKQCHMLGIEIWHVERDTRLSGLLVKQDDSAKLLVVLKTKIYRSQSVSLLTIVGKKASTLLNSTYQLLQSANIQRVGEYIDDLSHSLIVGSERVDFAANLIHEAYITQNRLNGLEPKQVLIG